MTDTLVDRNIQIAGSIDEKANNEAIIFSHRIVKSIAKRLLDEGATLVSMVDEEPRVCRNRRTSPARIFYWDVIETAHQYLEEHQNEIGERILLRIVCTDQSLDRIPYHRKRVWESLLDSKNIDLHNMPPGWTSSYLIRERQEELSDALVILGGSQGIEQLVDLYISHGKSVLPLDVPLGSDVERRNGVASKIFREAVSHPLRFFPNAPRNMSSNIQALTYSRWKNRPDGYSEQIVNFLCRYVKPQIFYVRLLNSKSKKFASVELFFRNVVDPVVESKGYRFAEIGNALLRKPLLDLEIFSKLNKSSILIVDLTGMRPNCLVELGYGMGIGRKFIITARYTTKMPFDIDKIPTFFWNMRKNVNNSKQEFIEHWRINAGKQSITDL